MDSRYYHNNKEIQEDQENDPTVDSTTPDDSNNNRTNASNNPSAPSTASSSSSNSIHSRNNTSESTPISPKNVEDLIEKHHTVATEDRESSDLGRSLCCQLSGVVIAYCLYHSSQQINQDPPHHLEVHLRKWKKTRFC